MQSTADYLAQLLKDRKSLAAFPNIFLHIERLLDDGMSLTKCLSSSNSVIVSDDVCESLTVS